MVSDFFTFPQQLSQLKCRHFGTKFDLFFWSGKVEQWLLKLPQRIRVQICPQTFQICNCLFVANIISFNFRQFGPINKQIWDNGFYWTFPLRKCILYLTLLLPFKKLWYIKYVFKKEVESFFCWVVYISFLMCTYL